MHFAFVFAALFINCFTFFLCVDTFSENEYQCYSRFDYEYKVVGKLVTLETAYKTQQEINDGLKDALKEIRNENDALKREVDNMKNMSTKTDGNIFSLYLITYSFHQENMPI